MPVDRGTLDAQLRDIGEGERWWEQREFRELPYVLNAGERIHGLALGKLLGARRPRLRPSSRWLLAVTDQRLLCLRHERFARKQVDIAWEQITRVHQSSGIRSYQITVWTPERRYRMRIPKEDALRFTGALEPLIPRTSVQGPGPELEALAWFPGMTMLARIPPFGGLVSRVALLSSPEYATREQVERLEATVERLQGDVERLQQQVEFFEDLLQKRAAEALLGRAPGDS